MASKTNAIADSSFILGVARPKDPSHTQCIAVFKQHSTIYLPQTTLAEVGYFLTKLGGNYVAADFLRRLPKMKYEPVSLKEEDFLRTADILEQYGSTRLDFVDATIISIAERLGISRILTLDRRDFSIIRPKRVEHFELLL